MCVAPDFCRNDYEGLHCKTLFFYCHNKNAILVMLRIHGLVHKSIKCNCEFYNLSVFAMRLGVRISGPVVLALLLGYASC